MIELHGWLAICETYEDLLPQVELEIIKQKIKDIILKSSCSIEFKYMNGFPFINTLFCSNHRTKEVDDIIETYKSISEIATGSYGIIYIRDDEDKVHYNEFQSYIFKRGSCTYKLDKDFSPCMPEIEGGT
ncbi:MAG: immunity 7 family protein [Ruminococcus sp.]|nr:immunity 7 family protein [Ruminococcus sp.]